MGNPERGELGRLFSQPGLGLALQLQTRPPTRPRQLCETHTSTESHQSTLLSLLRLPLLSRISWTSLTTVLKEENEPFCSVRAACRVPCYGPSAWPEPRSSEAAEAQGEVRSVGPAVPVHGTAPASITSFLLQSLFDEAPFCHLSTQSPTTLGSFPLRCASSGICSSAWDVTSPGKLLHIPQSLALKLLPS